MKTFLIITLFLLISGMMQHIIHEMLHLAVGKCVGLSVEHVTWFSHHGGTKVTFQDEDAVIRNSDHSIPKQWIMMNLADSGDLYLVSKYFHNSILIKLISVCMLIVNLTIFILIT